MAKQLGTLLCKHEGGPECKVPGPMENYCKTNCNRSASHQAGSGAKRILGITSC